ncbi:MAG: hypothetical protein IPQ06_03345 [Chitinophagaceae bacterium]|nr:hypothetical protein [Chitinophagaceae bacterium]
MKWYLNMLVILVLVTGFTSCQKEPDETLDNPVPNTVTVIPMFKVVEIDNLSPGQDSIIRILKTVFTGNQKTVVISEIQPPFLTDTLNTVFTYNAQGLLSGINASTSLNPAFSIARYKFTWNGTRLAKVVCDTSGIYANTFDFTYVPSGVNTLINVVESPSRETITPTYFNKYKHTITVDGQFVPVYEHWASHSYIFQGGIPENYHDTAHIYYSYSGGDVTSYLAYASRHDTSGAGGSITNIQRDTMQATFARSPSGGNIADSLKKIFGSDIYTLQNFELLEFYEYRPTIFSYWEPYKHFYNRPLTASFYSKKAWLNGVFDPAQSYTNEQEKKVVNSFDAQGRLIRSDVYQDFIFTGIETVYKISYY